MFLEVVLAIGGFALLYFGAEWLVKGSASLAKSLGVAPIVIGLTVVAFGTSAPELVVSLVSSIEGASMIAVGNVIGSNICNIALVLGLAAAIQPITCHRTVVRRDIPIMLAISLLLLVLCLDDTIHRVDGAILFGGIILYTVMNYFFAKKEKAAGNVPDVAGDVDDLGFIASRPKQLLLIVVGI
ncbi:MAG: sodium:calcium antiporter, partial [Planctomycetota bacterium]